MKRLITFLCIQVSITLGTLGAVTETFDDESVFPAFGLGGITATQHTGAFGEWTLYDGNGMPVYGLESNDSSSDDGDPSEGTSGLEYVLDDATKTAKVSYRIKMYPDGTWERIRGGYHGDIVIPETYNGYTVTGIREYAFDQCTDIPSVKLPKTLKQIEYSAFNGCTALKELIIPASVDTIYNTAFDGCSALEKVVFEDGTNVLKLGVGSSSAESGMFTWQPIKSVYIGRPYRYPRQKDWGWYIYYDLSAFGRCTTLEEVTFGESVTEIQPFEFILCSSLKKVTVNGTVTSLAEKAFYKCEKLQTINLPEGLTTIGIRAFEYCKELESIAFPSTLTMIDEYAFGTCESIKSLTIPAGVGSLGLAAFTACSSLKELILEDGPNELHLTHGEAGGSGYFTERPLEKVYVGRPINHPETGWAGYRAGAFSGIKTLKEVVVGEYVTELPVNEFMDSGLTTISLPKNLTKIGNFALSGCSSLNSITCEAVTPPTCGSHVFSTTDKQTCKLYVPAESIESYKAADVWKEFFNIESGINGITIDGTLDSKAYNLKGQRVNGQAAQKGLYILNGKKVFLKK